MGVVAIAGLVISLASLSAQHDAGIAAANEAAKQYEAQQRAQRMQGRSADIEAQRARIAQIREARIRRAQVLASTGEAATGSSGVTGATSSISTQASANIGNINTAQTFAQATTAANQEAAQAASNIGTLQAQSQMYGAIGGVGNSIFQSQGGWATIFGGNTHKKS